LIRSHEAFIKETGFRMKSGCEPEMTWFGDKLEVQVRPGASPAYHMGNLELMRPIYKRVMEYAISMGLDMIEGDYEDPGQLELNWMFDSREADCRPTDDLSLDLSPGRERVRCQGELHAEAEHRQHG
jgi:glutamine synthetase